MYPVIVFDFFPTIYIYDLFVGMALAVGYFYGRVLYLGSRLRLNHFNLFAAGVLLSAWAGAKIFFFAFSMDGDDRSDLFLGGFFSGGGFVFYGGLTFALLYVFFHGTLWEKNSFPDNAIFLPALALGHAIGRVGCFLAGCCFGIAGHPVQLYEAALLLALAALLRAMVAKVRMLALGATYFIVYGIGRFVLEFLRADEVRGIYFGFSTSQYLSTILVAVGSAMAFYLLLRPSEEAGISH